MPSVQTGRSLRSWGGYPRVSSQSVVRVDRTTANWAVLKPPVLPRGQGRSYGDVCLNEGGTLLLTEGLNRILAFDEQSGVIDCESGVTLQDLIGTCVPKGWFLAVTPGTKHATVGGAIANDVHGKNHPTAGSFGHHLLELELLRSDGSQIVCSPTRETEWFRATVGGLGLTGLVTHAKIRLRRIGSTLMSSETVRFEGIAECLSLFDDVPAQEYRLAWIDCLHKRRRGCFVRGDHMPDGGFTWAHKRTAQLPFRLPNFALNPVSVRVFNWVYNLMAPRPGEARPAGFEPFFYKLDALGHWYLLYGSRGFLQYQWVVPRASAAGVFGEITSLIERRGILSFLTTVKVFGDIPSTGWLSFARPGVTVTMDFPMNGNALLAALDDADKVVASVEGAVNPSKDARMSPVSFRSFFPNYGVFSHYIDPLFSSSFWRRVMG